MLMRLIPGDPAMLIVGDAENAAALAEARRALGLDQPLPVQFGLWLSNVLNGDLGVSLATGEPVLDAIADRFEVSAQVVVMALALVACAPSRAASRSRCSRVISTCRAAS